MTQKSIFIIVISILLFSYGCSDSKKHEKLVYDYFAALNEADFNKAKSCVTDSIIFTEGDFVLTRSIEDLHTHLQWDFVFEPQYKVLELTTVDKKMEAIISKTCKRIRFLHDSATVYKVSIDFEEDKISKMKNFDFVVFDFAKWQSRRDTLVKWVDENHPELTGFIFDQTAKGAQNYLKAIELYEKREQE